MSESALFSHLRRYTRMMAGDFDPMLYESAVAGDRTAVQKIVEMFSTDLIRTGVGMGLPRETAEDVAHGAWMKFFEHLASARQDPAKALREASALPFWLRTVTRNACRDVYRTARRQQELVSRAGRDKEARGEFLHYADPSKRLDKDEQRRAMWAGFEKLDELCRSLLLYRIQDPPVAYAEIAGLLDRPEGSIGPTLARCIEKLRRATSQDVRDE